MTSVKVHPPPTDTCEVTTRPYHPSAVVRIIQPMQLMQRVADQATELIAGADGTLIGLTTGRAIEYVCGSGRLSSYVGTTIDIDRSLSGLAVRTGEVLRSDDTAADPRVDAEAARRLGVLSSVCVPLVRAGVALGVLNVSSARTNAFDDGDVQVLSQLCDFVSVAIGLASDLDRISDELRAEPVGDATTTRFMMNVISPELAHRMERRRIIEDVIERPDLLTMVFQPIVDLTVDRVVAVEALARFAVDPLRTPDAWFADANAVGVGVELELLAATKALDQLDAVPDGVALSVNAGPRLILSEKLVPLLEGRGQRVMIELTEHAAVTDYPELIAALRRLRRTGVRVAVDDTGSGVSSLAHILKVAPDFIKLDRDLTSGIDLDPVRRALAASLVRFAVDTGASIVAEGVETADELEVIRALGIRYGQGYQLGAPAALAPRASVAR